MIVFTNAQVFDGVSDTLRRVNVTVKGERISGVRRRGSFSAAARSARPGDTSTCATSTIITTTTTTW